ncbi:hypothetical protein J6590_032080 [Homalodisca vitripennis]|nr:hypothetical protein J6590_032080 [Homalodisca vitripennis]
MQLCIIVHCGRVKYARIVNVRRWSVGSGWEFGHNQENCEAKKVSRRNIQKELRAGLFVGLCKASERVYGGLARTKRYPPSAAARPPICQPITPARFHSSESLSVAELELAGLLLFGARVGEGS